MLTLRVPAASTLFALRSHLNLTQAHLATLLGTMRWAVAQAEAGTRFLTGEAPDALSILLAALPLARAAGLRADLEALIAPTKEQAAEG